MQNIADKKMGTLYLVSTPIGNLKDITFRAVETLKSVGIVAAEDTRHTMKLLNHYAIRAKTKSFNDHNKEESGNFLLKKLLEGVDVALVSDAGTPGISDPGYYLVNLAHKNGIKVTACPGACAAIMALSISGMSMEKFSFFGFLPTKSGKRKFFLKSLANENKSVVFYESPGRIEDLLKDVYEVLGDRYVVLARELTKIFEETIRGKVSDILRDFCFSKTKGEFTVIISKAEEVESISLEDIKDEVESLLKGGASVKETSKQISDKYAMSKKEVYAFCLQLSAARK